MILNKPQWMLVRHKYRYNLFRFEFAYNFYTLPIMGGPVWSPSRPNNCTSPRLVRVESVRSWTVAEPSLNGFDQTRFKLYLTMSIICSVNTDINGRWSWVKCYCMYWKRSRKQTILLTHAERTPSPSKRYGPVQFIKSLHWLTIFRILASSLISHTIIFEWSFSLTVFSQSEAYQIN